ncbi:MAG: PIN domain-containing protein [Patulibacter sp.]
MALLDVNVLVALAWDSHVHHVAARRWFLADAHRGWATCSVTESGFVRVSSNVKALPYALPVADAIGVLRSLRAQPGHAFLVDDVSPADIAFPPIAGYRQVTDAHLLTLAHRHAMPLVTFDRAIAHLAPRCAAVTLLSA